MSFVATEDEVRDSAERLVNHFNVSAQLLGQLFGVDRRDQANAILQTMGHRRLLPVDVARLLVQRDGPTLLGGSREVTRELRLHLLQKMPDDTVQALYDVHRPPGSNVVSPRHMRRPLADKSWHSGGRWPQAFVQAIGLPAIFAGLSSGDTVPTVVDVPPRRRPPPLATFQEGLKSRMAEVLARDGRQTRCVVTLPTGGGKTRVAVEAFIDWMQPRFAQSRYLIWVAQSEELCEQAISCIEQMWSSRDFVSSLRVYRYFGGRDVKLEDLRGGVVVTSIQQLHKRVESDDEAATVILSATGGMIIDEAHRAVSDTYEAVITRAEQVCGRDLFAVCGLTATPGRSGAGRAVETVRLVDRFDAYLIRPDLGPEYESDPLQYFRDHQFLARAKHITYRSGLEYELTDAEVTAMGRADLPAGFLKRLAADNARNVQVLNRLLRLPVGTPTLVYSCTVDHAFFLAAILTERGRRAAAVSAETPVTLRRALINEFREGRLEFLCNYGVLTTGFDAPKTECIALCRPTTSEVLYEQIIGRGLRGPAIGGTPECTVIDFSDNIGRLGPPLAYQRFAHLWVSREEEN